MSQNSPGVQTSPPPPKPGPLGPPKVDMMASREMQAWIARLEAENQTVGKRNRFLAVGLAAGVLVLVIALWIVYSSTIGTYAVIDGLKISRDPASQGRVGIKFHVVSPGKVCYQRVSGGIETEVVDYFSKPGDVDRSWSWVYEPGKTIDVTLWYRRGLLRASRTEQFPTSSKADIVILMDTTGSMDRFIDELKDKCKAFSEQLKKQSLQHRFALIGFGDSQYGPWLDKHEFTADVGEFQGWVGRLERFDGGDPPESALDALEEGLSLPLDAQAIHIFYLVTDADYHDKTHAGAAVAQIAEHLKGAKVQLHVFSRPEWESRYKELMAGGGRFQEIENFGKVLSEGRVLED